MAICMLLKVLIVVSFVCPVFLKDWYYYRFCGSNARPGERPGHAKDYATYTLLHPLFYPAVWTTLYKKFTRASVRSFHEQTTPLRAASRLPSLTSLALVKTPLVLRYATDTCSQSGRLFTLP